MTPEELKARKRLRQQERRKDPNHKRERCNRQSRKRTYLAGPDRQTIAALSQEYDVCMICGDKCWRALCIDHDHETNIVRGFLCSDCNSGLGYFRDDPIRLRSALTYLKGNEVSKQKLIYKRYNGHRGRLSAGKRLEKGLIVAERLYSGNGQKAL